MLTIERKEEFIVIKKDNDVILECFQKIKPDPHFAGYYLGISAEKPGGIVLFSSKGEFIYKFPKTRSNACVSELLDEVVASQNIIQSMKRIPSVDFWTDDEVAKALRYKHSDLNKKRIASRKGDVRIDVLYDIEKTAIEKFLGGKQAIKVARERGGLKSRKNDDNSKPAGSTEKSKR